MTGKDWTRDELRSMFRRDLTDEQLDAVLVELVEHGLVEQIGERWTLTATGVALGVPYARARRRARSARGGQHRRQR